MPKLLIAVFAVAVLVAGASLAASGRGAQGAGEQGAARGLGVAEVEGRTVLVEVFIHVAPGQNAAQQVREELDQRGARPLTSADYSLTGLAWGQFSDDVPTNDFVLQYYNPGSATTASDPTGGGGLTALLNTHTTWGNVATSNAAFAFGGTTTRCPSLVNECPGDQVFDGFNDVAWLDLGRCSIARCTLGVTWFSTSAPHEADMALNTRVTWRTNGSDYDVETVLLHENGHVLGLGHSNVTQAIMYAYYNGTRRTLHQDDIDGITFLYPASDVVVATPTPAPTSTATPTPDAEATFTATPTSGGSCPPGHQRQGRC